MGINKVVYNGGTLIDLTGDTVTADKLIQGYTAHDRSGTIIIGTAQEGGDVPVWQGTDDYVYLSDTATAPVEIYVDDDGYVVLDLPPAVVNLQTKTRTYTPSALQQTDTVTADSGYDGLEEVDITVNAIQQGEYDIDIVQPEFYTENNVRKWRARANMDVWGGWLPSDSYYGSYLVRNAVPSNTSITPTTSSQTVGGANYVMESAVTVNAVPVADFYTGAEDEFYTQNGVVKYHYRGYTEVDVPSGDTPGYISDGTHKSGEWEECDAIPSGTYITPTTSSQSIGGYKYVMAGALTVNPIPSQYIIPSGTKSITSNGTGIDVTSYASVDVNVPTGGGGGLEFETGTFAPASDISRPTIYFNGNHSTPPIAIIMEDTGSFPNTTYTNVTFQYIDWYRLNGVGNYSSGTNLIYSYPSYSYIGTGTSTLNGSSACTGSNSDSTTDTYATNSRYWAKPDCFMPSSNSTSRYWRSGRSYKWLAVWAPTS